MIPKLKHAAFILEAYTKMNDWPDRSLMCTYTCIQAKNYYTGTWGSPEYRELNEDLEKLARYYGKEVLGLAVTSRECTEDPLSFEVSRILDDPHARCHADFDSGDKHCETVIKVRRAYIEWIINVLS